MIVSPDGSCRDNEKPSVAIEIKCPVPGKTFTPDVHYSIPVYYIGQILSEMKALECTYLLYVCWTPKSCTVQRAEFDEELWLMLTKELKDIYYPISGVSTRPKRKSENVAVLKKMIKQYIETKVVLLAEFPSSVSLQCGHTTKVKLEEVRGYHISDVCPNTAMKHLQVQLPEVRQVLMKAEQSLTEIYNVLRAPAKEVVVALISDLDRTKNAEHVHAIPIAYGLSGYSLKVDVMRSMINEILEVCNREKLVIRVVSSDGQFYKLCVRDENDKPLTLLQLAKDTWAKAKKLTKQEQLQKLMSLNYKTDNDSIDTQMGVQEDLLGNTTFNKPIHVLGFRGKTYKTLFNPPKLLNLMKSKLSRAKETESNEEFLNIDCLSPDVINSLDDNDNGAELLNIDVVESANIQAQTDTNDQHEEDLPEINGNNDQSEDNSMQVETDEQTNEPFCIYKAILCSLKEEDRDRKKKKWQNVKDEKIKELLSSEPEIMMNAFTKKELAVCASYFRNDIEQRSKTKLDNLTKVSLVNTFSALFGNKTTISKKKSPKSLRGILKDVLTRTFGKDALNAIMATDMFLSNDLPEWRANATFKDGITVGMDSKPYMWYSQPEYFQSVNRHLVYLLDCHHLFVNARCFVVQNGITGLGIKKEAWFEVAESNYETHVGLSIAMVKDVIDRQSNTIAQVTFSEKVEEEMTKKGWMREAKFCKIIRNWYRAEDEPGLNVMTRHNARMEMRKLLIESINIAEFPPCGSHVAGMPAIMFEGILTNIDRIIQLYALVPEHSYNVRAPNTLDAENLFSEFRELDPKSTGALMADDIPCAIETASYIMQMRLNPERKFLMHTASSVRVYPANVLHTDNDVDTMRTHISHRLPMQALQNLNCIVMRNHTFDNIDRRGKKPKRKSAYVPSIDQPARGTQPVRQHHKVDASKILPHVRYGLSDI